MITGAERFAFGERDLGFSVLDFWRYAYSELNSDPRDDIAEYLVSSALGLTEAYNRKNWTVFDILYPKYSEAYPNGYRVEVKCTGYYQTWRTDGKVSRRRAFSIRKSQDESGIIDRHSDAYVFCLLNGDTSKEADPLRADNWDFYIIATGQINAECGENKSISLQRVRKMSRAFTYEEIRDEVDRLAAAEHQNVSRTAEES